MLKLLDRIGELNYPLFLIIIGGQDTDLISKDMTVINSFKEF